MSKTCPVCKRGIQDWETLCSECWSSKEDWKRKEDEVINRLRGKAKKYLLEFVTEHCRLCKKVNEDVSSEACQKCEWNEKEKLIRAFLE